MARPPICRRIGASPAASYFKPRGIPLCQLQEVVLELDEIEALRLADLEGLYQVDAAAKMGVSRQTFANIVNRARNKVAEALIHGKALKIVTGAVHPVCNLSSKESSDENLPTR